MNKMNKAIKNMNVSLSNFMRREQKTKHKQQKELNAKKNINNTLDVTILH